MAAMHRAEPVSTFSARSIAADLFAADLFAANLFAAMTFAVVVAGCMSSQTARGSGGADVEGDVEAGGSGGAPPAMAGQPGDAGADSEPSVSCTYAQMESNCQIRCYSATALVSGADCSRVSGALQCTCQYGPNTATTFAAPHCGAAHEVIREHCGP